MKKQFWKIKAPARFLSRPQAAANANSGVAGVLNLLLLVARVSKHTYKQSVRSTSRQTGANSPGVLGHSGSPTRLKLTVSVLVKSAQNIVLLFRRICTGGADVSGHKPLHALIMAAANARTSRGAISKLCK